MQLSGGDDVVAAWAACAGVGRAGVPPAGGAGVGGGGGSGNWWLGLRDGEEMMFLSLGRGLCSLRTGITWRWHFYVIKRCSGLDCSVDRPKGCSALCTWKTPSFPELAPWSSCVRRCSDLLRREARSWGVAEHALNNPYAPTEIQIISMAVVSRLPRVAAWAIALESDGTCKLNSCQGQLGSTLCNQSQWDLNARLK